MNKASALRTILLITGTIAVCCAAFFFFRPSDDAKTSSVREAVEVVFPEERRLLVPAEIEGTLRPEREIALMFLVSGTLEAGEVDLVPGTRFTKGQLLAQINNREAFAALNRNKAALAGLLELKLQEIRSRFPDEERKWTRFVDELRPQFLVPGLPAFSSPAERQVVTDAGIVAKLEALSLEQEAMKRYFYLAPFDGFVTSAGREPGSHVQTGETVARIAKDGKLQLYLEVPAQTIAEAGSSDGSLPDFVVCLPDGDTIGKRGRLRGAPHSGQRTTAFVQQVYSIELRKSRQPKPGSRVIAKFRYYSASADRAIPSTAVRGEFVQVVRNGKLETRRVAVTGETRDTLFVTGLRDGDAVVVRFRHQADPDRFYYPKK